MSAQHTKRVAVRLAGPRSVGLVKTIHRNAAQTVHGRVSPAICIFGAM